MKPSDVTGGADPGWKLLSVDTPKISSGFQQKAFYCKINRKI